MGPLPLRPSAGSLWQFGPRSGGNRTAGTRSAKGAARPYPLSVSDLEIKQTRFGAPAARTLVAAAQADLAVRYGEGDQNPVESIEFDPPEGAFFVAYLDGQPVACGGWRTLSHFVEAEMAWNPTTVAGSAAEITGSEITGIESIGTEITGSEIAEDVAEIKRVYAVPAVRGTGVAAALLAALEDSARVRGMRRIVLETGHLQPEAISFYGKLGYQQIENYGYYRDQPGCLSFGRDL
jgi:GNAT superfamily N-acetyltransferase